MVLTNHGLSVDPSVTPTAKGARGSMAAVWDARLAAEGSTQHRAVVRVQEHLTEHEEAETRARAALKKELLSAHAALEGRLRVLEGQSPAQHVQERLAELESRVETKTAAALHQSATELHTLLERRVGALQADTERRLHTVHTEVSELPEGERLAEGCPRLPAPHSQLLWSLGWRLY